MHEVVGDPRGPVAAPNFPAIHLLSDSARVGLRAAARKCGAAETSRISRVRRSLLQRGRFFRRRTGVRARIRGGPRPGVGAKAFLPTPPDTARITCNLWSAARWLF